MNTILVETTVVFSLSTAVVPLGMLRLHPGCQSRDESRHDSGDDTAAERSARVAEVTVALARLHDVVLSTLGVTRKVLTPQVRTVPLYTYLLRRHWWYKQDSQRLNNNIY